MYDLFMYIAIPSTIVMIIFIILSLIGADGVDSDMETDIDVDGVSGMGFPTFSIKNITAFLTMFGWVGMACVSAGLPSFWVAVISLSIAMFFVVLLNFLFVAVHKLAHSSPMTFDEGVGQEVTVHSKITKETPGQIAIILNSSLQVVQANSDTKTFQTGETVKVVSATKMGFIVDSI
jgi:membrane protein implicated in regulation of membrane protease activity